MGPAAYARIDRQWDKGVQRMGNVERWVSSYTADLSKECRKFPSGSRNEFGEKANGDNHSENS